ncbi:MAG: TlpA family protein disulfide reductase [Gammaproteobacteria bacterium]|nr:MAG: TlpA family protein disulfide reductase [Gammaproteobacteria bacterium]
MRNRVGLAALVMLTVTAGLGTFLATRLSREPEPRPLTAPDTVIPERRPDVTLADVRGQPRSLSHWDGRALIINFWATWCAPCRREIPMLNGLAQEFGPQGFEVIGIAVDFREDVLEYLQHMPLAYETLIGEQEGMDAARAFGVGSVVLPFTVFTDRTGRIVTLHLGELHRPQAEVILGTIRRIDAGELLMPAGRSRIEQDLALIRASSG